jgi:hypothetical protein
MIGIATQFRRKLYMGNEAPWKVYWQENLEIFWHKPALFNAISYILAATPWD